MPDTRDTTVFPAARQWLATTLFLVMSAIAAYYMHGSHPATRTVGTSLAKLSESTTFVFPDSTIELRRTYTGLAPVDAGLSFLVAAFMTGVRGLNDAFRLQQIHFLFSFLPVLTVWSVESARKGSAWAAISFTSVWALGYQTVGGAIIIPLWYIFFLFTTSKSTYWKSGNEVPSASSKALLPALVLGYVLPTTLMFLPWDPHIQQGFVAFWQPAPLLVNLLWVLLARVIFTETPKQSHSSSGSHGACRRLYAMAVVISAIVHVGVMLVCLTSGQPQLTFRNVFWPNSNSYGSMSHGLHFVFKIDEWIIMAAVLLSCYICVFDLSYLGLMKGGWFGPVLSITLAALALGPGAAVGGTWYWREGLVSGSGEGQKVKSK